MMKLNLLVVEDDFDVRDSIISSLDDSEIDIITAADGHVEKFMTAQREIEQ